MNPDNRIPTWRWRIVRAFCAIACVALVLPAVAQDAKDKQNARNNEGAFGSVMRELSHGAKEAGKVIDKGAKEGAKAVNEGSKNVSRTVKGER